MVEQGGNGRRCERRPLAKFKGQRSQRRLLNIKNSKGRRSQRRSLSSLYQSTFSPSPHSHFVFRFSFLLQQPPPPQRRNFSGSYNKEEGPDNVFEMDSHLELDIYGDFEYDLEDEDYIGAIALKASNVQEEGE